MQSAEVFGDGVVAGSGSAPVDGVGVNRSTDFSDGAGCRYCGGFAGDKTGDGGLGVCQRGAVVGLRGGAGGNGGGGRGDRKGAEVFADFVVAAVSGAPVDGVSVDTRADVCLAAGGGYFDLLL